jgi:hypothetical protein
MSRFDFDWRQRKNPSHVRASLAMLSGVQTYDVSAYILVKGVMSDVSLEVFQRCVGAKRKTVIAVSEVSRTAYCDHTAQKETNFPDAAWAESDRPLDEEIGQPCKNNSECHGSQAQLLVGSFTFYYPRKRQQRPVPQV